jgi:hypothetical protein
MVCVIPLASIFWDDEMPDYQQLMKLSDDERRVIWRLFGIRFRIWDREVLSTEDQRFWEEALREMPSWAAFRRLSLSAEDQMARENAQQMAEEEFEDIFESADQVQVVEKGHGIKSVSVTFDRTTPPPAARDFWWSSCVASLRRCLRHLLRD